MLDLLRKIFGIRSPSKIQREKCEMVGRWLNEGLAKGIKDGEEHPFIIGIDLANGEDFTSSRTLPQK